MKRIFISHSSRDKLIIKQFVDLFHIIGMKEKHIFYSSSSIHGVDLGNNIYDTLKRELSGELLVIFVLSDNFYNSPVCLCEMGATWVKTQQHIPILIPPFEFEKIKGVFSGTLAMKINDKEQLNNLKLLLEKEFDLEPIHISRWEEKRDEFIILINKLIEDVRIENMEKEIMDSINSSKDKRINTPKLKSVIGYDPKDYVTVGNLKLKRVFLGDGGYALDK